MKPKRKADIRQLSVVKEEVPSEHQERSCSLDQDQEHPEPPHIKEEQEELWISQEGEQQLQGLEEADITKFIFTPVPVKSEDDGEKPQSSQLHQTHTEHMETEAADSSETEVSDDDWMETREKPQSGSTSLTYNDNPVRGSRRRKRKEPISCSVCGKIFIYRSQLKPHMRTHTGEKPFRCRFCIKSFARSGQLQVHMRTHTGEKPFTCSECGKVCGRKAHLKTHMMTHIKTHTGPETDTFVKFNSNIKTEVSPEPEDSADIEFWKKIRKHQSGFTYQRNQKVSVKDGCSDDKLKSEPSVDVNISRQLQSGPNHLNTEDVSVSETGSNTVKKPLSSSECHQRPEDSHPNHNSPLTGEKPFSCSVCGKEFLKRESLRSHMTSHNKEKPFHCSVCNAGFSDTEALIQHMRIHTIQTQFSCQICGEEFAWRRYLTKHMEVHSKETIYSCSAGDKTFRQPSELNHHQFVGELQLHESQTEESREAEPAEAAGEDCGGPEPDRNSDPDPDTEDQTRNCSEPEADDSGDSDFWTDNSRHLSVLNSLKHEEISQNDQTFNNVQINGIKQEEPEPPHIKEEQEELWSSQEGEQQLQGLEEADITKFTFTSVPVKSEDDGEKPQSSQLHQTHTEHMETEAAGEDCGGPGPHRDPGPERFFQPVRGDKSSDSSEPETDVSDDDCREAREPVSGSNSLRTDDVSENDGKKYFICTKCGQKFVCKDSLRRHTRLHTGEKPYSCSVCGKTFKVKAGLNYHLTTHTGERPYSCSVCGKTFKGKAGLKYHLTTHTGERPYSCSVCGKTFKVKGAMTYHMAIHTGAKRFSCSVCHKRFKWLSSLTRHRCVNKVSRLCGRQNKKSKGQFSCPGCDTTFPNNYMLEAHIRLHRGKERFTCSVCERQWHDREHLFRHMRTHTGERPYSCSFCGKTFISNDQLKVHTRTHSEKGPFSCSVCAKTFLHRGKLRRHKAVHIEEKLFRCRFCIKSFARSGQLQVHMRTHTGEKPFTCSECGKVCGRKAHLNTHMMTHIKTHTGPETDTFVKFNSNIKTEVSPEPEDSADIEFWKKIRKHQSGFTYQRNQKVSVKDGCSDDKLKSEPSVDVYISRQLQSGPNHLNTEDVSVSETGSNTVKKPLSSSECHQRPEDSHLNHNSPPTGEKPFSCSVCRKGFTLEPQLISHKCAGESLNKLSSSSKRQQARLKPFSCSVCRKEFLKRESLRSHMTSHNKEKPFHCSVCNAGFSDTEALIQHMRIHTIQTQFSCQICGEEFAWRRYLTKHVEVHSKETIYSCSAGDKTFRQPELNHHQFVGELQLHESQTEENREAEPAEAAGEDCGGPEPDRNSDPDPDTKDQTRNCSEPEDDDSGDSDFWTDNSRHLSVLNSLKHEEISQNDQTFNNAQINGIKQEEPEPPHIKEEQEELWISQEGEQQLQGLEEADITKFTFTPVPVKSEDDEEKPQSSQLHQTHTEHMETEAAGEDCGGPGPHRDPGPERFFQPVHGDKSSDSSEPETNVSDDDCREAREPVSGSNSLRTDDVSENDGKKYFICTECGRKFGRKDSLRRHTRLHTGGKLFRCSVCHKIFVRSHNSNRHKCVQSSQLNQGQTGEDCGGPGPDRNSDPEPHLPPGVDDQTRHSSEPETDDSDYWKDSRECQSGLNSASH